MRGRFAIPVHDPAGVLLAYCGRAVKDESPLLLFPNGFDPRTAIFNAHRITEGDLFLVRDPLQVLKAQESGIENVVAFLTEIVAAQQLEQLAALMDIGGANIWRYFELAFAGSFFRCRLADRNSRWRGEIVMPQQQRRIPESSDIDFMRTIET